MKFSNAFQACFLLGASLLMLQGVPAVAADDPPAANAAGDGLAAGFDWIRHTQVTLDELKGKLSLAPAQTAAWETWSGGVMQDARQRAGQRKALGMEEDRQGRSAELTTPEQMARGIERMRSQVKRMQERLAQLELAQARTETFYDALDAKQKTIFDLFWHEMFHRVAGHDGDMGMMHSHMGFGSGPVDQDQQEECCSR
jgi:hypothetical protein